MAKRRTTVEELEARVLLSGELAGALALPPAYETADQPAEIVESFAGSEQHQARHELVFIDARVEDWETLVEDLVGRSSQERVVKVVMLDSERDGLSQISETLADYATHLDAVHVVSHGTDAGIQLGGTWLDQTQLANRADLVAGWQGALSEDADLLLYGCNLAASSEGKALVESLATLTGADVAASVDLTGALALGGDWDLEHTTGSVETLAVFSAHAQQGFGTLLDGTAVWTDKVGPGPQTSDFDGTDFGAESDTNPMGQWEVIVGAESPTRDEKIIAGVDGSGNLGVQTWDGTSWTSVGVVATGLDPESFAFDVAYSSGSGDALFVWADSGGLNHFTWDGGAFSPTATIAVPTGGAPTHLKLAADPNSDEMMLVGSNEALPFDDFAMVWDGTGFFSGNIFPFGFDSVDITDINVVYEGQSGNAMVVYGDATESARYSHWNGASWSGGVIAPPSPGMGEVRWTDLAADPNSNTLALVVQTQGRDAWLTTWNGTAWQPASVAGTDFAHNDRQSVAVAFESSTGKALAVYGADVHEVRYRTWGGGAWSGEQTGPDLGGHIHSVSLDSDPYSDAIMLSALDSQRDVHFVAWDGTSFGAPNMLENDTGTVKGMPFVFMWEQNPLANTAPVLTPTAPSLPLITEDEISNSGELVSNLLGSALSDPDVGALGGIAVTGLSASNGSWEYSLDGGSVWSAVPIGLTDAQALLLRDSDRLRFVPDGRNGEVATFDFRAWDQTTGTEGTLENTTPNGGTTAFSTASDTGSITVSSVNDAPVLNPSAPSLTPIAEGDLTNTGDLVSSLLGLSVVDVDNGDPQGMAITGLGASSGVWEFSTDGGSVWNAVAPVSNAAALLLRDTDRVRFVPDAANGEIATFDFRAWDQSSGTEGTLADTTTNGGASAFSTGVDTASITVSSVNDAPVLDASGTMTLTNVVEDDLNPPGDTVVAIVLSAGGNRITDVDLGDPEGFAVVGVDDSNGTWEYSTDGGSIWTAFGVIADTDAVLLDATARIRFVPTLSYQGLAGNIDFRAWDQSVGTNGQVAVDASTGGGTTPFSTQVETATLTIIAINDAPVLVPGGPSLPPITEDETANGGEIVSTIVGTSITDADAGAVEGIAITGLSASSGSWEFSLDGGTVWNAIPTTVSDMAALLLGSDDWIRFVPDAQNGETPSFDFRAWDQTSGVAGVQVDVSANGGTTAFSVNSDTASINVSSVNDAPVLTPATPSLTPINEDDLTNAGDLVSSLLGLSVSDVDTGDPEGIAITALTSSNGTWEFSTDGGSIWNAVPTTVSNAAALLLRDSDRVRFVPDGLAADTASFDFRAWDQRTGTEGTLANTAPNGGTTAFSIATDTASIAVTSANDAPVLDDTGTMSLTDVVESAPNPAGDTVADIILSAGGNRITDADLGDPEGIAVVAVDDTSGSWQYSTDGGSIWTAFGAVSNASAVLLDTGALVRFVPNAGYVGPAGDMEFRAWDQSLGGNGQSGVDTTMNGLATPFSTQTETASLNVTAQNFAPVLTPGAPDLTPISEDETGNGGDLVSSLLAGSISDPNLGSLEGMAITGLVSGNGTWQYSTDGGASWTTVGAVSNSNALLVRGVDRLRFVPDESNADSTSFDFRAWDQTSGTEGNKVDASAVGGTTAFSVASDTASIAVTAVNDAPAIGSGNMAPVSAGDTNPSGETVSTLFGVGFGDVDSGSGLAGIAVVGNTANATNEGVWQYSSDGGGSWFEIGSVADDASALVLSAGTRIRFVPVATFSGDTGLTVRGLDDSYAGTYSSTASGSESRSLVDTSLHGGATAIASSTSDLSTSVLAAPPGPDVTLPPPAPTDPPPEEPPPVDAEDPPTEVALEPPTTTDGGGGGPVSTPSVDPTEPTPDALSTGVVPAVETLEITTLRDERVEEERGEDTRTALDVLRDVYLGRSPVGANVLTDLIWGGGRGEFLGQLDAAQEDVLALQNLETRMVSSSIAITSGLSVGYVLWLTRGGLLIASLLSSMPAWRLVDPIPILARLRSDEEEDENEAESLDSMVNADADSREE